MTSYPNTSLVDATSRLSSVLGMWSKKTDIDSTISSNAVEVDAHRDPPPPNFSFPLRPPVIHSMYCDHQGATHSLETSPFSSETFSVPPPYSSPYSPRGIKCTGMEKHTEVSYDEEPPTLARILFKYGFLFFPFWLAGIYILQSPLLPTPDWEAGKNEEEKAQLLQHLRKTELKWAYRCLWAMLSLLVVVSLLVLIVLYVPSL